MAMEALAALELAVPGMERAAAGLEEDLSVANANYTATRAVAVASAQIILKVNKPIFKTMSNKEFCTFMGTTELSYNVEAHPERFSKAFKKAVLDRQTPHKMLERRFGVTTRLVNPGVTSMLPKSLDCLTQMPLAVKLKHLPLVIVYQMQMLFFS